MIAQLIDWEIQYTENILNLAFGNLSSLRLQYHSLEYLSQSNVLIIGGEQLRSTDEISTPFVLCLNASSASLIWQYVLSSKSTDDSSEHTKNTEKRKEPSHTSAVLSHWKLRLLEQHRKLQHLQHKSTDIDMRAYLPVSYHGGVEVRPSVVQRVTGSRSLVGNARSRPGLNQKRANSVLITHKQGIMLLDLNFGIELGRLNIDFDLHSTYSTWSALGNLRELDTVQIKFISKLDQSHNDHIDIHHGSRSSSDNGDAVYKKIHCNLVFARLTGQTPEANEQPSKSERLLLLLPLSGSWSVGHLCDPVNFWDYPRFDEVTWLEDNDKSLAPVVSFDYAAPSGFWGRLYHLVGRKVYDSQHRNVICMSSDGLMTSYSSHGHINWRVSAQVGWLHISRMTRGPFEDSSSVQAYRSHFQPSMTPITLFYYNDSINAMLTLGFDSFSLIDTSDGHLLASHSLPCTPTDKPVVVATPFQSFWSLYGDQIFVVECENMIIGFSLTYQLPWTYFISITLVVFCTILFLAWSLDPKNPYFGDLWSSS